MHIGGRPEPSFVLEIDTQNNIVFSGQTEGHPGLHRYALKINEDEIHYLNPTKKLALNEVMETEVRIRYRQPLQKAKLIKKDDGLYILFEKPQKGITPGQFAVWYEKEELIGSGIIA